MKDSWNVMLRLYRLVPATASVTRVVKTRLNVMLKHNIKMDMQASKLNTSTRAEYSYQN